MGGGGQPWQMDDRRRTLPYFGKRKQVTFLGKEQIVYLSYPLTSIKYIMMSYLIILSSRMSILCLRFGLEEEHTG